MLTFCALIYYKNIGKKIDLDFKRQISFNVNDLMNQQDILKKKKAIIRWKLLYTLINNIGLTSYRYKKVKLELIV